MIIDDVSIPVDKRDYMLSTLDNPYNPHTNFDRWYLYDELAGYHTCEYLARVAVLSDDLSEEDQDLAIRMAIDEILDLNLTGNYIKVFEDSVINPINVKLAI